MDPRLIVFLLPQFHPTPENDEWWGAGFTDWTNVAKGRPRFVGHYQPHIPADLGFYDLRAEETQIAQAALAEGHGIHGFCYYHYWFSGRRLLSKPLDNMLRSGKPDFPFCLCWANEDWTRAWDGRSETVLIKQEYSQQDDAIHMDWLSMVFQDDRYIRVNDRPIFLVYRARQLPSPRRTADLWRDIARKRGVGEILLCQVESFASEHGDPQEIGFDAAVEFQPDWSNLGEPIAEIESTGHRIYDYADFVQRQISKPKPSYLRFPGVNPGWDNSPRRPIGALTLAYSEPETYRRWLSHVVSSLRTREAQHRIVFINAWNEWAEGNHLEPDLRFQRAYLKASRDALNAPAVLEGNDAPHGVRDPFSVPQPIDRDSALPDAVSAKLSELAACSALLHRLRLEIGQGRAGEAKQGLIQDFSTALDNIIRILKDAEQHAMRFYGAFSLNDQLISQEQLIRHQHVALENLQSRVVSLEKELAAVLNSRSWRMTQPLREIHSAIGRLLTGIGPKR